MLRVATTLRLVGSLAPSEPPAPGDVMIEEIDGLGVLEEQDDLDGAYFTYDTWRHESYGIVMAAAGETMGGTLRAAALEQQTALAVATTAGSASGSATSTSTSDEGFPIGVVLILAVLIGLVVWMLVKLRRTAREARGLRAGSDRRDRTADEIIAEARGRAREEVDAASDEWQLPDGS